MLVAMRDHDREVVYALGLEGLPGVEEVIRVLKPYKLVSRDFQPADPEQMSGMNELLPLAGQHPGVA